MTHPAPPPVTTSPLDSRASWLRLAVAMALGAIGGIGFWGPVVILPAIQAEFAVDRADASLPYAFTMIGFAIGNVVIGRYVDRMGITRPLVLASLALGGGFITAAVAPGIWPFAVLHGVLIGMGTAAVFGPLIADVSHWFQRYRGIAVAATASGNYIAGTLWSPLVQWVAQAEGLRTAYLGIGVVCIVTMVPLALLLRRPAPIGHGAAYGAVGHPGGAMFAPRTLMILLCVAGVGCCVAMSMPQVHLVAYAASLGYGPVRGTEMLTLMMAGGVVSRLVSGVLADRIGGVRTLLLGSALQCMALALYLPFDSMAALYAVSLIFGLAQGGIVPCYAIVVREFLPAAEAAQRIGIVVMATIVGMSFGGWITGWIFDLTGSYNAAIVNGIGWNLLNLVIVGTILWRSRQPARAPA